MESEDDTGRVTLNHNALEDYVFPELISLIGDTKDWRNRLGE